VLLKEITDLNGISGNEDAVRDFIKDKISCYADEIRVDRIGNLIAFKKGYSSERRIMLSAHMDEVGFIVTGYGENGTIKFKPVGGIDEKILPGKKVRIGDENLEGVIGCKPVHLLEREERTTVTKLKDLYIDIGAERKEEAEKLAPLGEYIAFDSEYTELGEECVKAKALDDRVGCIILMEALKGKYEFDLYACFTVQEEVGLRGAETAAYAVNPDIALILEGTTCSDVPGVKEYEFSTRLGEGPALTLMDRTAYTDKKLTRFIYDLAVRNNVKIQFKQTASGGNDAGKIQRSRGGTRIASISVPCRYIHSPVSMMSLKDFEGCKKVVELTLNELGKNAELI
jgi:endoglucanase